MHRDSSRCCCFQVRAGSKCHSAYLTVYVIQLPDVVVVQHVECVIASGRRSGLLVVPCVARGRGWGSGGRRFQASSSIGGEPSVTRPRTCIARASSAGISRVGRFIGTRRAATATVFIIVCPCGQGRTNLVLATATADYLDGERPLVDVVSCTDSCPCGVAVPCCRAIRVSDLRISIISAIVYVPIHIQVSLQSTNVQGSYDCQCHRCLLHE